MRHWDNELSFKRPFGVSVILHFAVAAVALWTFRSVPPPSMPPAYKVNIVAAPPGPRQIGVVEPPSASPPAAAPAPAPPQTRQVAPEERAVPLEKPAPTRQRTAPRATPAPATKPAAKPAEKPGTKAGTAAPRAGGGPIGDKGTDVATIKTEGLDFPFPNYINNIVRQIALNFKPQNPNAPLRAVVSFTIRRDGTVTKFKFETRSGVYAFDLEAKGAVEKAAPKFGPLPDGFENDVLPVTFTFDPQSWK